jgi:hypothetical protein
VPRTSSTPGDQAILVDQTTDASLSSDAVMLKIDRFGPRFQRRRRVHGSVRLGAGLGASVIAQDLLQMALVPDKGAVRELAPTSPDPVFGNRVHAGCPHVAQHGPDPGASEDRVKRQMNGPRSAVSASIWRHCVMNTSSWLHLVWASRWLRATILALFSRMAAISFRFWTIMLSRLAISHPRAATSGIQSVSSSAGRAMGHGARCRLRMTAPGSPG